MAIATASTPHVQDDPFALYVVDSEGPPLVHVSRTRRSEIVVFGRRQRLFPPIVLGTGPILLNAAENDEKIELSKIVASRFGDADIKITATLELADVVREQANLGLPTPKSSLSSKQPTGRKICRVCSSSTRCQCPTAVPRSDPGQGVTSQARRRPETHIG